MATRKIKILAGSGLLLAVAGGTWLAMNLFAAQAQGTLSQHPMNLKVSAPPSFIMAVDDSGSMTFQTQFPGQDGTACWSNARKSFFKSAGVLNKPDDIIAYDSWNRPYNDGQCNYFYLLPGPRINTSYLGIPALDVFGFARSAAYNPAYYDPSIQYQPWLRIVNEAVESYPASVASAALIDPRNQNDSNYVVNVSSSYLGTRSWDVQRMQDGMYAPPGQRYMTVSDSGRFSSVQENKSGTSWSSAANASLEYTPATFYMPFKSDGDPYPQLAGTPNAYANAGNNRTKVLDACGKGCHMWKYVLTASDAAAMQNFANWFTYYGNRNRAMIAGMTHALNVNDMYVGYFRINDFLKYNSSTDAAKRLTIQDMSLIGQKTQLYNDMIALTASGGTPNRNAVNAAGLQFMRTDDAAPIKLSCQKNAVMLFTDGYSNNGNGFPSSSIPTPGNIDGAMGAPFKDSNSDTMADIAAYYYVNPLRTDTAMPKGNVPVPEQCATSTDKSLDCNKNLHINFYGITLGARGNLFDPDKQQNPYTDSAVYSNWPSRQNDNPSTVDDIWHAATNTRGEYINARTPADITAAMRRVLSSVTSGPAPSGSQGLTGARIGTGSLAVTPQFEVANEETDWFSRLKASKLAVNDKTQQTEYTQVWEAAEKLGAQRSRTIVATKGNAAVDFSSTNIAFSDLCNKDEKQYPGIARCSATEAEKLGGDIATAMAYLRGDASREVRNSGGIYRTRTTVLGDIVNSSPVISSPRDDYGYQRISTAMATSYATYLTRKRNNGRYMVYVGANDGMLHAFDGGMNGSGVSDGAGGSETFAYIPGTALGHMANLLYPYVAANKSDQRFRHRYYVDGPIAVADAQIGGNWATALVGTAGAGGRSVFALDVTTPSSFGTGNRLWEISDVAPGLDSTVKANIGHVLGKPVIVPVKEGTGVAWKAIFGNGYNSLSRKAVLFVVDLGSGAVRMITATEAAATAPAGDNGLGNIVAVDRWRADSAGGTGRVRGRDGLADTIYAADQRGALWKFDLESTATSVTTPVFTTARQTNNNNQVYRQPITGGMTAVTGPGGGVMLVLGTGSFSFDNDPQDLTAQSLYGVNDTSKDQPEVTIVPANLVAYTVTTTNKLRTVTATPFSGAARGWSIALPGAGERFVGNPAVASGTVFMPTYMPTAGGRGCSTEGSNWLFGLNPISGVASLEQARVGSITGTPYGAGTAGVSLDTGGTAPVKDVNVSVMPRLAKGADRGGRACWMAVNVAGAPTMYVPYPCGRQSWRQIQ
ncbi:pilus assembly protein [Stenotrophomonas maltophilia]|uniref:pilus assembly protein n=1 Tax=Stenotrophomonas maltophilia TaxID=40324 RepID=UPI00066D5E95|nr:PilC/PilY family type IV pilus protein [Stenotrophomonas maltophilia]ELK2665751.1 pilus assembly protein [Stenotrophomonas maltophilia]KUJ06096.1 pilus assembly protein [Stenotrophomonas maltophilia]MBB5530516.1 type IV pilus assembly protein PilY1 [Stenotrophomonas maltophilia]MBH1375583.1 pilus assembly protein [Stenotrophomonas maltophilia]MBH1438920.1 pilus assembly protein [Stenotrophomonas maltophilia]